MNNYVDLKQVIWVASRPPIPPFTGITLKTLSGVSALVKRYSVQIVTFVHPSEMKEVSSTFSSYWQPYNQVQLNLASIGAKSSALESMLRHRFQFGLGLERSDINEVLQTLKWDSPDKLVLFDDIVLAPLLKRYGCNALISPHDCISEMFRSHYRMAPFGKGKAKLFTQYRIARSYESHLYQSALLTHLVTQRDRVLLEHINPHARYHVVPNQIPDTPNYIVRSSESWDILIWADLTIPAIASSVRQCLEMLRPYAQNTLRILLVGRAPIEESSAILSRDTLSHFDYSRFIEDDNGAARGARVVLVPDIGGAGIKNRCLSILASGQCLACLYSQMEGIEKAADIGAINAFSLSDLIPKILRTLEANAEIPIAKLGQRICCDLFSTKTIEQEWQQMLERAQVVKFA